MTMKTTIKESTEITISPDEIDIKTLARRWCIWNVYQWPDDVPMPETLSARRELARSAMKTIMETIGWDAINAYWREHRMYKTKGPKLWAHNDVLKND